MKSVNTPPRMHFLIPVHLQSLRSFIRTTCGVLLGIRHERFSTIYQCCVVKPWFSRRHFLGITALLCPITTTSFLFTVEGFLRNGERQPWKNVHDSVIDHANFQIYWNSYLAARLREIKQKKSWLIHFCPCFIPTSLETKCEFPYIETGLFSKNTGNPVLWFDL